MSTPKPDTAPADKPPDRPHPELGMPTAVVSAMKAVSSDRNDLSDDPSNDSYRPPSFTYPITPAPRERSRACQSIPDDAPPPNPFAFPKVGETFLGFRLIDELGRGGFGRVYLAQQQDLADRPVALKVMIGSDAESQNLARLQHTNIVPIYSSHRDRDVRAVCMPFFGRSTLADLCVSLHGLKKLPNSGSHVVCTLHVRHDSTAGSRSSLGGATPTARSAAASTRSGRPLPLPTAPLTPQFPNLTLLLSMSYVDAILWIGGRIADGLAHAHERGIIHRDLKPANVLLTDDGQPMILDFNLAVDATAAKHCHGGTVPFMSPEQLFGMTDGPQPLDPRTDVYSLGVILYQLLTGRYPFPQRQGPMAEVIPQIIADRRGPRPPLHRFHHAITPTVEAIVHKCLAPDPADRYQSARDLLEDLELHRADCPVRHAPNPSPRELAAKWVRRHPKAVSPPVLAAAVALLVLCASAVSVWSSLASRRAELERDAVRGQELVTQFDTLHGTAEQYLTSHNGNEELLSRGREGGLRALDTLTAGHADGWLDRAEFRHLPDQEKERLKSRAAELVFLLGPAAGGQDVSPAMKAELAAAATATSRGPILRAAELHAAGKFGESIPDIEGYVRDTPDDAGGWFLLGRAQMELGRPDDAYLAYSTGIALRPRYAAGYYFRAVVADSLKKPDPRTGQPQALLDINRAVELDRELVEARLFRAQLYAHGGRLKEARQDLDDILDRPAPPTRGWLLRAVVRERQGDPTGAAADRKEGLKREPQSADDYIARGVALRKTDPRAALADFRSAERLEPLKKTALEHQAYVQAEVLKQPAQAADTLTRLLDRHPNSPLAFISRAVYLGRCGRTAEAVADAERAAKLSTTPGIEYRVGCVYALAAKADPAHAAAALRHLAAALKAGFGFEHLLTDSDLDPLRTDPDFGRLADLVKLIARMEARK